jgi:hypothetical protein
VLSLSSVLLVFEGSLCVYGEGDPDADGKLWLVTPAADPSICVEEKLNPRLSALPLNLELAL